MKALPKAQQVNDLINMVNFWKEDLHGSRPAPALAREEVLTKALKAYEELNKHAKTLIKTTKAHAPQHEQCWKFARPLSHRGQ